MDAQNITNHLIEFLAKALTPWHVTRELGEMLSKHGFCLLSEQAPWELKPETGYFFIRDGAAIAWKMPRKRLLQAKILAAHTDSPCLKIKPNPESFEKEMNFLFVEPYGSPILTSWLNRDLIVAGRVICENSKQKLEERVISFSENPVIIPSIALHLSQHKADEHISIDKQKHLAPLVDISGREYLLPLLREKTGAKKIIDFDLFLVSNEKPSLVGKNLDLLAAPRIDNLTGVHAIISALTSSEPVEDSCHLAVFFNHEEIGSRTSSGAFSAMLSDVLARICLASNLEKEEEYILKNRSTLVSVDAAHGFHPSFRDKYDPNHTPMLGKGPVFKYSAAQKYTTSAQSSAALLQICDQQKIPFQKFISHSNISAGSTIGPIAAAQLGISAVDIGIPQLSMHSIREIMAVEDQHSLVHLLTSFLREDRKDG